MPSRMRQCVCCTTKYEYCGHCERYARYPSWMTMFHNANCRSLWYIASDYVNGKTTKDEAYKALQECDLSYVNELTGRVGEVVKEILGLAALVKEPETNNTPEEVEQTKVENNVTGNVKPPYQKVAYKQQKRNKYR